MMYMRYKSAKLGIWTSWESPRGLPEIVILDWDWIEPVGVNQVRKRGKCVSGKGNCMYKAESTLAWICLYPTSKGSQGRFFSSESERVMSISWYIFRKDHASAHWGLRTSGLAWTLAAVLQGTATTLSRPMAWRWSLLSTCLPPHSKETAGFGLQWYVTETARKSGRAFCQRALFLFYLKISIAITSKFWH